MMWPPSILRVRVSRPRVSLWIPVFLIWPVAILIALLLAPFVFLAAIVLWPKGLGKAVLLVGPNLLAVICGLRGLRVDFENDGQRVLVSLV